MTSNTPVQQRLAPIILPVRREQQAHVHMQRGAFVVQQ